MPSQALRPASAGRVGCALALGLLPAGCGDPCNQRIYADSMISAGVGQIVEAIGCKDPAAARRNAALVAQNEMQLSLAREIRAVQPLPAPLAPAALVVLPPSDELLHRPGTADATGVAAGADDSQAGMLQIYTGAWHALIDQRRIFARTRVLRAADYAPRDGAADEHVILADYDPATGDVRWYLLPAGGGARTEFFAGSPVGKGRRTAREFLGRIETLVAAKGPAPASS